MQGMRIRRGLLAPFVAAAACIAPAATASPAHAAAAPSIWIGDFTPTMQASLSVVAMTSAPERMTIVNNTVLSSLPLIVDANSWCTPAQYGLVGFFGYVYYTTCNSPHGIASWKVSLGAGDDTFVSQAVGSVEVDGGAGNDHLSPGSVNGSITANGQDGADTISLGHFVGSSRAYGQNGSDTITASKSGSSWIDGGVGSDTIYAAQGIPDSIICGEQNNMEYHLAPADTATDFVHVDGPDGLSDCQKDVKSNTN
jgi:hypothetical protein